MSKPAYTQIRSVGLVMGWASFSFLNYPNLLALSWTWTSRAWHKTEKDGLELKLGTGIWARIASLNLSLFTPWSADSLWCQPKINLKGKVYESFCSWKYITIFINMVKKKIKIHTSKHKMEYIYQENTQIDQDDDMYAIHQTWQAEIESKMKEWSKYWHRSGKQLKVLLYIRKKCKANHVCGHAHDDDDGRRDGDHHDDCVHDHGAPPLNLLH